jgi:hypothetical protein
LPGGLSAQTAVTLAHGIELDVGKSDVLKEVTRLKDERGPGK